MMTNPNPQRPAQPEPVELYQDFRWAFECAQNLRSMTWNNACRRVREAMERINTSVEAHREAGILTAYGPCEPYRKLQEFPNPTITRVEMRLDELNSMGTQQALTLRVYFKPCKPWLPPFTQAC